MRWEKALFAASESEGVLSFSRIGFLLVTLKGEGWAYLITDPIAKASRIAGVLYYDTTPAMKSISQAEVEHVASHISCLGGSLPLKDIT